MILKRTIFLALSLKASKRKAALSPSTNSQAQTHPGTQTLVSNIVLYYTEPELHSG